MMHWVQKPICDTPLKEHEIHEVSFTGFSVSLSVSLSLALSLSLSFSLCVCVSLFCVLGVSRVFLNVFFEFFFLKYLPVAYTTIFIKEKFS